MLSTLLLKMKFHPRRFLLYPRFIRTANQGTIKCILTDSFFSPNFKLFSNFKFLFHKVHINKYLSKISSRKNFRKIFYRAPLGDFFSNMRYQVVYKHITIYSHARLYSEQVQREVRYFASKNIEDL